MSETGPARRTRPHETHPTDPTNPTDSAGPSSPSSPSSPTSSNSSIRRLADGRPLPSGRAVVGGLLVAVAMVATYALATHPSHQPPSSVVVARHALTPGTRLAATDLAVVRVALTPELEARSFGELGQAVGTVALGPIGAGDLVARSAVARPAAGPGQSELAFPIARERALDGDLQPGEVVEVLATYGTGTGAQTLVVARHTQVLDVDTSSHASLASAGQLVVTVGLDSPDQALAVAHAGQVGALTLVRVEGTSRPSGMDRYALPTAETGDTTGPP